MDQATPTLFNPHLQRVLKTYQTAAGGSLNGPPGAGPALWPHDIAKLSPTDMEEYRKAVVASAKKLPSEKGMDYDPFFAPPPFPIQPSPFFIPLDATRSEKVETLLEGEKIACFRVGGEKRLCLPQILNTVLRDFTLQQINAVCDDLHIFCSRCNPEQLEDLKVSGILPLNAPSCGLITKTDAERLCNALLHCSPEPSTNPPSPNSFKVYHECFGKCKGVFNPELYISEGAKCIQCLDCRGLFSPAKFVSHSHKAAENRTCHWGFDSANWRSYLLLAKDQHGKEKLKAVLDEIKLLYDHSNKYKRKQAHDRDKADSKKGKYEDGVSLKAGCGYRPVSAFRPWSPSMLTAIKEGKLYPVAAGVLRDGYPRILPPYLQTGPPVLLNPERVIPLSESDRYERHFAPNVSLAPMPLKKIKGEGGEETPLDKPVHIRTDHKEYELSTDTEDSVRSSPLDTDEDRTAMSPPVESTLERELELVRGAIFGSETDSGGTREKQFQEFSKLRARQEEQVNRLAKTRHRLRKENDLLKINLRESNNLRWSLQKEIETVRIESECRLQNADETKQRLMKELDSQRIKHDKEMVRASTSPDSQDLRLRLRHFEELCGQYQRENIWLREELKHLCGEMSAKPLDKMHFLKSSTKIHDNGRIAGVSPRSNGSSNGSPKAASSPPERHRPTMASPERHRPVIASPERRHPINVSDTVQVS